MSDLLVTGLDTQGATIRDCTGYDCRPYGPVWSCSNQLLRKPARTMLGAVEAGRQLRGLLLCRRTQCLQSWRTKEL